jgi:hypothetical protein
MPVTIRDVRVILTAPQGSNLVVVNNVTAGKCIDGYSPASAMALMRSLLLHPGKP